MERELLRKSEINACGGKEIRKMRELGIVRLLTGVHPIGIDVARLGKVVDVGLEVFGAHTTRNVADVLLAVPGN